MRIRILLLISALAGIAPAHASTVSIASGRKLVVDGQPYSIKGVNYSPTPVGFTLALPGLNCAGPFHWWTDRQTYMADFPQIRALGANTIRTFDLMNSTPTAAQVREALDAAQANGLKVIM